jgi:membrane associated rhomboid family serine protease
VTPTPEDLLLLQAKAKILLSLICLLWGIHALNWVVFKGGLNETFGIRPREIGGLVGVVTCHFLHDDEDQHLPSNTRALFPLGGFVLLQGIETFYATTIIIALVSGIGVWLFAKQGTHVGASMLIYGYLGFLLIYGLVAGNLLALLIALMVGFRYGSQITGTQKYPSDILPGGSPGISWEGHLFGFIGGIVAAYFLGYLQLGAQSLSHY